MKKYELMTIIKAGLGEDKARDVSNSIKDQISSNKGKVLNSDFWGKRKFSYEIEGDIEGYYEVITFDMDSLSLANFKKGLTLQEGLLRYLITSIN